MGAVEAIYVFDEHNSLILSHVWAGRPPSAQVLLPLYQEHPPPRPSLMYESSTNPPTLVHSISQDGLLFLCPTSNDIDPLIILEFLHRVVDVFEDFLGSPLLSTKISNAYDVVAQILNEMCDCGAIATTEPNALRDIVEAPSLVNKLLGGVGLPSSSPSLASGPQSLSSLSLSSNNAPAIPWRRSNIRHTSNELYVDIVETLHIIAAPSGQPLSAFAYGSIVFTAKVSGVPDLFLSLNSQAGGPSALANTLNLPVFHPCVRLARWKDRPGDLSFVPPDGRFVLMGYEVDLLGPDYHDRSLSAGKGKKVKSGLHVPVSVSVKKGLGPTSSDFEVRLSINPSFAHRPGAGAARPDAFTKATGFGSAKASGTSAHPVVEDIVVKVPVARGVRSLGDMKASRGEARWAPGEDALEWRVSSKAISGLVANVHSNTEQVAATLRCSVAGAADEDEIAKPDILKQEKWEYDEADITPTAKDGAGKQDDRHLDASSGRRRRANEALMPSSASVSFEVRGWLASGIKVDKLVIDTQKSRGIGAGVQPYKGVKYVTVSQDGIETRC